MNQYMRLELFKWQCDVHVYDVMYWVLPSDPFGSFIRDLFKGFG